MAELGAGNHDQPRIAARVGDAQAGWSAVLCSPCGARRRSITGRDRARPTCRSRPSACAIPWEHKEPGRGRDPERTPMQWQPGRRRASPPSSRGCPSTPGPVPQRRGAARRARLDPDPASRLIALRREHPALSVGDYRPVSVDGDVLVYERRHADETIGRPQFGHGDCRSMRISPSRSPRAPGGLGGSPRRAPAAGAARAARRPFRTCGRRGARADPARGGGPGLTRGLRA